MLEAENTEGSKELITNNVGSSNDTGRDKGKGVVSDLQRKGGDIFQQVTEGSSGVAIEGSEDIATLDREGNCK